MREGELFLDPPSLLTCALPPIFPRIHTISSTAPALRSLKSALDIIPPSLGDNEERSGGEGKDRKNKPVRGRREREIPSRPQSLQSVPADPLDSAESRRAVGEALRRLFFTEEQDRKRAVVQGGTCNT